MTVFVCSLFLSISFIHTAYHTRFFIIYFDGFPVLCIQFEGSNYFLQFLLTWICILLKNNFNDIPIFMINSKTKAESDGCAQGRKYVVNIKHTKVKQSNQNKTEKKKNNPYFDKIQTELYCFSMCCCCWCMWCKSFRLTTTTTTTTTVGVRSLRRTFNFSIVEKCRSYNSQYAMSQSNNEICACTTTLVVFIWAWAQVKTRNSRTLLCSCLSYVKFLTEYDTANFSIFTEKICHFLLYWNYCIFLLPKWVVQWMNTMR